MGAIEDRHRQGRSGTDIPSIEAVRDAVARLVRKQWYGWSTSDREDLQQVVLIKYFNAFGRDRLPDDDNSDPAVPINWLSKVIRNAGVDFHRHQQARPADPTDFDSPDAFGLERLMQAMNRRPNLSSAVAQKVDVQRMLKPALEALADAYPSDARLIALRFVQDRDVEDIAKIMGKSPDATKKAVQRAINRLRDLTTASPSTFSL